MKIPNLLVTYNQSMPSDTSCTFTFTSQGNANYSVNMTLINYSDYIKFKIAKVLKNNNADKTYRPS